MLRFAKVLLPILFLAVGGYGAWKLIRTRPPVEVQEPEVIPPLVRVQRVTHRNIQFKVRAQGTVFAPTQSALVPEVSGRVTSVSQSLAQGAFFEAGEELLRIDPQDFELAVVRSKAEVARSEYRLEIELAEAEIARQEWQSLGQGEANPLLRRVPQLAEARANLESAKAALLQSERDLERTVIRAPFTGRVREKSVDLGQFVSRGATIARLYSVDFAEVRLPIPDEELAFLDLPIRYRGESAKKKGPRVRLTARFAGADREWWGRIVRTEGEIDPRTRMVHAIARVEDPYGRSQPERPPLAVGLFVQAEILGKHARNVVIVPRSALRGPDRILVLSDDDRLFQRRLRIVRNQGETVVVGDGLRVGERICLSPLDTFVEGMSVRTDDAREETREVIP